MNVPTIQTFDCGDCPIRHRAVCARCDSDELEALDAIKYYRTYDAGQSITWSGDRMDFVGSVVSGIATLTQTMEDGRTQMVGLLLPSDFVGRPGRDTAAYNVVATSTVVMCCFRRKPFEDLMSRTPHIAHRLLEMTLDELDAAREWMLVLGRKTAREKIASLLSILARRDASLRPEKDSNRRVFDLPLTREAMADYLADLVRVVVIDPPQHGPERSDPGGLLCQMLSRHGVKCEIDVLSKSMTRVSDVLNRHAVDTAADLIVMGAYGHSRFREAILGGATRNMLEKAKVPVLMAH